MIKVEYFTLEESPYKPGKYTLRINFDKLPEMRTTGSFNLLPARLLNLSYAQYLRFCRDIVGAYSLVILFCPFFATFGGMAACPGNNVDECRC